MNRRDFSHSLLTTAGAAALAWPGLAGAQQGAPIEGRHYVRLSQPLPVGGAPGKLEVVEFFWYGCPHCNAFEPALEAWVRQLPADVSFRRVPVAFRAEPYGAHQRLFFALDTLGAVGTMQRKVFYAVHQERQALDKPADMAAFVARHGIDPTRFLEAYHSFGTQTRVRQANQLVHGYKIDGVPALGVQGRFYTSGSLAGDNDRALLVTDFLLQRLRKPG